MHSRFEMLHSRHPLPLRQQLTSLYALLSAPTCVHRQFWSTARPASAAQAARQSPPRPVGSTPLLCLERAVGPRSGADAALWESGAFQAQVYPDLPAASSWGGILERGLRHVGQPRGDGAPAAADHTSPLDDDDPRFTVTTVAAQCRSREQLRTRMTAAARSGAAALLLVSGSHPARHLPFADRLLQNSVVMLRDALTMRQQGMLPPELSLWAVENPGDQLHRLLRKADAGAEVVLTQPPFFAARSLRWFEDAAQAGVGDSLRIVPGVPMASSRANLDFWLQLAGVRGDPEASQVLDSFPTQGTGAHAAADFQLAVRQWNADFIAKVGGPAAGGWVLFLFANPLPTRPR